jgi:hypothetical protein
LKNQVGSLSQPNNPLAAYNAVCHSLFTNQATGVLETYYFPCTNAVVPTPGS